MLPLSLLITLLAGFFIITAISTKFSYLERLGGGSLIGFGIQAFIMMIYDFIGINISLTSIYIGDLIIMIGCLAFLTKKQVSLKEAIIPYNPFEDKKGAPINVAWVVLAGLATYLWWLITQKCLFYPPFEFDTVAGYDLMAKVLASEGTFHNSLFNSDGKCIFNMSHRSMYPPLVSGNFGYAYMSGAVTSKAITSVIFTSFLLMVYGLLRQLKLTHLNTIFTVLLMMLIPEFVAHSSLSQTNMPQGVYSSLGIISFFIWFRDKENKEPYFILSVMLLSFNCLIRLENVVFGFLMGLLLLGYTIKNMNKANIQRLIAYGSLVLFPIILWLLYIKINGLYPNSPDAEFLLGYDHKKLTDWWGYIWGGPAIQDGVLFNKNFFGLTPHLYFIFLVISSVYLFFRYKIKKETDKFSEIVRDHYLMIYITFVTLVVYSSVFYFIEYNWDSFRNVMAYSYKRGLFVVMILFSFFLGNNFVIKSFFSRIDAFLYKKA